MKSYQIRKTRSIALAIFFVAAINIIHAQTIRYVKPTASGLGDGSSWANASGDLKATLNSAGPNTEIWVAAGTYVPSAFDKTVSFSMKNDVKIFGGFVGTETMANERNPSANLTRLSGEIGSPFDNFDNSLHVIKNTNINNSAIMDGFIIENGAAFGSSADGAGGCIYNFGASPKFFNCIIRGGFAIDKGGAIYNGSSSFPLFFNCSIISSQSAKYGGAIYNDFAQPSFENCKILGNTASRDGGGIYNAGGNSNLSNCLIAGNRSAISGGGIYNASSAQIAMDFCTIAGNYDFSNGGGINNNGGTISMTNSILWGNSTGIKFTNNQVTASYCIIQGETGYTGSNNFSTNPLFVSPASELYAPTLTGNYALQACSPAINAGDPNALLSYDLLHQPRPQFAAYDIGAYEFQSGVCSNYTDITRLFVNENANGTNNGTSWFNALNNLDEAFSIASSFLNITEIWVAGGTYNPTSINNRDVSFNLRNDLGVYGGFSGSESTINQRNIPSNPTMLSGSIGNATDTDNSIHVVYANGVNQSAILDGFTITGGYANGGAQHGIYGGGMLIIGGNPMIKNCIFQSNYAAGGGGGIHNTQSTASFTNCAFEANSSGGVGGGMYNAGSNISISSSTFQSNYATSFGGAVFNYACSPNMSFMDFISNEAGQQGGAMHSDFNAYPVISNSTFTGNKAGQIAGAIMTSSASGGTYTNCTITGNEAATNGGAMYCYNGTNVVMKNSIIWNNRAAGSTLALTSTIYRENAAASFERCIVANSGGSGNWNTQIGTNNGNNLDQNPRFTEDVSLAGLPNTSGNVRPLSCSPAINTGNDAFNSASSDLDGNARLFGIIDMGAFEYQGAPMMCCPAGNVIYVKANATGFGDGSSWANAYTSLQDALANACPGITEIWVAGGTYYTTGTADRFISFVLRNNLAIYGGFAGTETALNQRIVGAVTSTLLGNIGNFSISTDNSYHIVTANNVNNTAVLDGFRIASGYASNGSLNNDKGGGMLITSASPTIANCTFALNYATNIGGAIYATASTPTFTNCIFENNSCGGRAGAIANYTGSNSIIEGCTFRNNLATTLGGAIFNSASSPQIKNTSFYANNANQQGGAMHSDNLSSPIVLNTAFTGNYAGNAGGALMMSSSQGCTFTNCTITGNGAGTHGGAMYCYNGPTAVFRNCIIWNNKAAGQTNTSLATNVLDGGTASFQNCIVANSGGSNWTNAVGSSLGNNLDLDPIFIQDVDLNTIPNNSGNISIVPCSPALNAGNNTFNNLPTDLNGNSRLFGTIDMGATELSTGPQSVIYVDGAASGSNDGTSWTNAFNNLQSGLSLLSKCVSTSIMHIAAGTYPTASDFTIDKENAVLLGGYINGGGLRNPVTYQTVLQGEVRILAKVRLEGLRVEE